MDNMNWRKSSYSSDNGGECVDVASPEGTVAVRDTRQNGVGPVLRFAPAAWRRFADQVKRSLASDLQVGGPAQRQAAERVRVTRSFGPDSVSWGRRVSSCGPRRPT